MSERLIQELHIVYRNAKIVDIIAVAFCMDAWIEILLRPRFDQGTEVTSCEDAWIEISAATVLTTRFQYHLHGCADWNTDDRAILFFSRVAFCVDKWIEIYLGYWVCYLLCECVDWNMSWLLRTYRLWELQIFALVVQLWFVIKLDKICLKLVYNIWYK